MKHIEQNELTLSQTAFISLQTRKYQEEEAAAGVAELYCIAVAVFINQVFCSAGKFCITFDQSFHCRYAVVWPLCHLAANA